LVAAVNQGLAIGLGSCGGEPLCFHGISALRELELWATAGIPIEKVIHAATLVPARILGMDETLGSVEPGKVADLVVLSGDVTDDATAFRRVVAVFRGGQPLDLVSLGNTVRGEKTKRITHPAPDPAVSFSVDTLDQLDMRLQVLDDRSIGGSSTTELELASAEEGRKVLTINARLLPSKRSAKAFSSLILFPKEPPPPWDVRGFRGIRLGLRGSERPLVVLLSTFAVRDGDDFRVNLTPRGEWSEIQIPFKTFHQLNESSPVRWTGEDVTSFRFLWESDAPEEVHLELAEIGFY